MPFFDNEDIYRGLKISVSIFEHEADKFEDDGFTATWVITSNSGDSTFDHSQALSSIHKTPDEAVQIAIADARAFIDKNLPE